MADEFQTVTYINSTAAVKALSDWVVTSGNAEEIIQPRAGRSRILVRARSASRAYLEEVTGRKMILWNGACMVHEIFSVQDLLALKKKIPAGNTIAHPGMPRQHPRALRFRRRHRGDDQVSSIALQSRPISSSPPKRT